MSDRFDANSFGEMNVRLVRFIRIPRDYFRWLGRLSHYNRVARAGENAVKRLAIDLIHAHTEDEASTAVAIGKKFGIPVVVTLHGQNTGSRHFVAAERTIYQAALGAAGRVVLVGEPLRAFFSSIIGRDDHFRLVSNGVLPPQKEARLRFVDPKAPIKFISVSNLYEGKGIEDALTALAIAKTNGFSEWDYTVVGDGDQRRSLERLAGSKGIAGQVRFLGARNHDEVYGLLDQADVFLLPSYRESFGIAYLEAMASGLLAIGIKGQGPEAFIANGETGFLTQPRNPDALANLILDIAANRAMILPIAAAGAKLVRRNFTWDDHARRLIEVYRELVA